MARKPVLAFICVQVIVGALLYALLHATVSWHSALNSHINLDLNKFPRIEQWMIMSWMFASGTANVYAASAVFALEITAFGLWLWSRWAWVAAVVIGALAMIFGYATGYLTLVLGAMMLWSLCERDIFAGFWMKPHGGGTDN